LPTSYNAKRGYVVICNAGLQPGAWMVGAPAAGHVVGRVADTARRSSTVCPVRATHCFLALGRQSNKSVIMFYYALLLLSETS